MKNKKLLIVIVLALVIAPALYVVPQSSEPWKPAQLMSPADLAKTIKNIQDPQPFVYCVGPGALIQGSIDIGPGKDSVNVAKFRRQLSKLSRDATVVIYCGCCPFENCPNIRPAFALLNEMKFRNAKLLNLEHNIRVDWIDKGYPTNK